jgi:hypothetical protein
MSSALVTASNKTHALDAILEPVQHQPHLSRDNGLVVQEINPRRSPRFSPNLYRWLTSPRRPYRARLARVYRDANDLLWIGHIDERDFIGCKLNTVLCYSREESMCYGGLVGQLRELPHFWSTYTVIGRCAIDPKHQVSFLSDESRWKVEGDLRHCQWCHSFTQELRRWTVTVQKSAWLPAHAPTPA